MFWSYPVIPHHKSIFSFASMQNLMTFYIFIKFHLFPTKQKQLFFLYFETYWAITLK